jgi:uncharacterized membrane protein
MEDKGFIGVLFDLSFSEFITTRVIKVLYIIGIAVSAVFSIVFMFKGYAWGGIFGIIGTIVLSPVVFLLMVVLLRIYMEMVIVLFRIAENIQRLAHGGESDRVD